MNTMTIGYRALALLACLLMSASGLAQREKWANREFGVGVIRYAAMQRYDVRDVVRASPSESSDTVALLDKDSLWLWEPFERVRSYDRMIEYDYEQPDWAILGFNSDSTWARVSLDPWNIPSSVGWVKLDTINAVPVIWADLLPEQRLFFLRVEDIAFYSGPDTQLRVERPLSRVENSAVYSYIMNPIAARDRWLQVELFTPSNMCNPDVHPTPDTLWIRYLTIEGRPRVFFYTRGC